MEALIVIGIIAIFHLPECKSAQKEVRTDDEIERQILTKSKLLF